MSDGLPVTAGGAIFRRLHQLGVTRIFVNSGTDFPPITDVAKQLHMSTRTVKRKLAEHGTTFSALRDDQRRQRALLLLDNRELSIGEVAQKLGYSELPNFTRAFKKWTGMTPVAYRDRK